MPAYTRLCLVTFSTSFTIVVTFSRRRNSAQITVCLQIDTKIKQTMDVFTKKKKRDTPVLLFLVCILMKCSLGCAITRGEPVPCVRR